ncbi:undecaprenyl-phosphate glucose phosphotransferase [soil metagenome]
MENLKKYKLNIEVIIPVLTIISDCACVILAFLFGYWVRFYSNLIPFDDPYIPDLEIYITLSVVTLPFWIMFFNRNGMYKLKRNVFITDELFTIIKSVSITIVILMGILFFYRTLSYSRIVFVAVWFSSIIFITFMRYILLKTEKNLHIKGIGVVNTAIIGNNETANKIFEKLSKDKFVGFNILGFFSYEDNRNVIDEKLHLGDYTELHNVVRKYNIEKLIISISSDEHEFLIKLLKVTEGLNIELMLAPDFIDMITSTLRIEEVDGIPFMKIKSVPMTIWNRLIKRTFDILVSLVILVFISPVMLLVSFLIKMTSKGPLFYKQERVSLDNQKFLMLKFRSMRTDAEKDGPQMTMIHDNRYTSIGKLLRKYSLDELPQFINVLKGDMSIVGPRPEREYFISIMKNSIHKYLERHRMKCGITGWAQVNGLRGTNTPLQTRIDYDLYYIENWSITFDMKIIFKTIKEMFFSKEAF